MATAFRAGPLNVRGCLLRHRCFLSLIADVSHYQSGGGVSEPVMRLRGEQFARWRAAECIIGSQSGLSAVRPAHEVKSGTKATSSDLGRLCGWLSGRFRSDAGLFLSALNPLPVAGTGISVLDLVHPVADRMVMIIAPVITLLITGSFTGV